MAFECHCTQIYTESVVGIVKCVESEHEIYLVVKRLIMISTSYAQISLVAAALC